MPIGAPPPPPPAGSGPPALPFLQAPAAIASAMSHTASRVLIMSDHRCSCSGKRRRPKIFSSPASARRVAYRACPVTTLLDAEVLARHEQPLGGLLGGGAGSNVAVVGGGHVTPHRANHVLAPRARDVVVHPCLTETNLALPVVPQGERNA